MRFWIEEILQANDGSTKRQQRGGEGRDCEFGTSECYVRHTLQTESYHLGKKDTSRGSVVCTHAMAYAFD